jgi:hypothetical protein
MEAYATHVRRFVPLLPLALLVSACGLAIHRTQPASLLVPGQRVRLEVPESRDYIRTGTLVRLSGDSVTILRAPKLMGAHASAPDLGRETTALGAVFRLEVSRGRPRPRPLKGVALGAVSGAYIGLMVIATGRGHLVCECGNGVLDYADFYAWTVGGGIVGGLMGWLYRPERWTGVPKEDLYRVRVGVAPLAAGRLGLGAALSF